MRESLDSDLTTLNPESDKFPVKNYIILDPYLTVYSTEWEMSFSCISCREKSIKQCCFVTFTVLVWSLQRLLCTLLFSLKVATFSVFSFYFLPNKDIIWEIFYLFFLVKYPKITKNLQSWSNFRLNSPLVGHSFPLGISGFPLYSSFFCIIYFSNIFNLDSILIQF